MEKGAYALFSFFRSCFITCSPFSRLIMQIYCVPLFLGRTKETADPSEPAVGRRACAPQGRCMSDEWENDRLQSLYLGFIHN